jgi:hypothetical protein
MKNTLAENMLRFGSKNLSEASKKKLQRLAEQGDLNGVKSMLALPGVTDGNTVTLKDIDPAVKTITINTEEDKPVPAGPRLFAVANNAGAVVSRLSYYNLVIGNIGEYDTANRIIKTPVLQAVFTNKTRIIPKNEIGTLPLAGYIKSEEGIAQLFAKLCLTVTDNNQVNAGELYAQQYNNLIATFKLCTLTNTAPIPNGGDPKTDMALKAFNDKVGTYISRGANISRSAKS